MADDTRDMLMKFPGVAGEAMAVFDTPANDPLSAGFQPGNFFEVKEFDFGVAQIDDAGAAPTGPFASWSEDKLKEHGYTRDSRGSVYDKDKRLIFEAKTEKFKKFMETGSAGLGKRNYPADLEPFGFTRLMDVGSMDLFTGLTTLKSYPMVSLVKRKAVGGATLAETSTVPALRGYLRFDFTDVLLTSLDWDEDDVIREKIKFVCRGIKITYYAEAAGGKLDKTLPAKVWDIRAATK